MHNIKRNYYSQIGTIYSFIKFLLIKNGISQKIQWGLCMNISGQSVPRISVNPHVDYYWQTSPSPEPCIQSISCIPPRVPR